MGLPDAGFAAPAARLVQSSGFSRAPAGVAGRAATRGAGHTTARDRLDAAARPADVEIMGRIRRRAAAAILACMALGLVSLASAGHAAPRAVSSVATALPCHAQEAAPGDAAPASPAAPCSSAPCRLAFPLLCCAQPAAADATAPGLSCQSAIAAHTLLANVLLPPLARRAASLARTSASDPPRERSVVLQV